MGTQIFFVIALRYDSGIELARALAMWYPRSGHKRGTSFGFVASEATGNGLERYPRRWISVAKQMGSLVRKWLFFDSND